MSTLNRDANRKSVGGGVNLVDSATPLMLMVDPVTNRLLIDVTISGSTGSVIPKEVGHDQNRKTTAYGVLDNAVVNTPQETLSPLIIDHTNGYLFVDIING